MDLFGRLGYFIQLQRSAEGASDRDGIVVSWRVRICAVEGTAGLGALARRWT